MRCFLRSVGILAGACALGACVATVPYQRQICGQSAWMLPDSLRGCPSGALGCARFDGAEWLVAFPSRNQSVMAHELEHVCGMMHKQPWVTVDAFNSCTEVTHSGQSHWQPGQIMCVGLAGKIELQTDPVVATETRRRQLQGNSADLQTGFLP
jgi:hypothetical protein